jgi:SAM-dependent methyltransferase
MRLRQIVQFLDHLPAYAGGSVITWRKMIARISDYGLKLNSIRVLEVGCGYAYPYVVLFDSVGANVVGIDVLPLSRREIRPYGYAPMLKARGLLPTICRLARDLSFRLAFDLPLGRAAALPIHPRNAKLARMDAARMGFADATFDFVYSSACFEHLEDVPIVAAEIARILKPEGIAEIEIHLFTSMTGGHEPELYDHRLPPPHFRLWGTSAGSELGSSGVSQSLARAPVPRSACPPFPHTGNAGDFGPWTSILDT